MRHGIPRRSALFLAGWAAGVALVAWAGSWPDGYLRRIQGGALPLVYPWQGVLAACAALSLTALLFYALLRPESYRASWGRALAATLAGAAGVVVLGMGLMHAPPYLYSLWLWLAAATTLLLALFLVSSGGRVRRLLERLQVDIPAAAVAEVRRPLSTVVLTHWRAPMTDGFRCLLPAGLRLTATEGAPRGSRACTFVPSDPAAFDRDFVPPGVTGHPKYAGVSVPLSAHEIRRHLELIGRKSADSAS